MITSLWLILKEELIITKEECYDVFFVFQPPKMFHFRAIHHYLHTFCIQCTENGKNGNL